MRPYYEDDAVTIYHGDARELLSDIACPGDVWLTDPPYASGGFQEAGRASGSMGKRDALSKADRITNDTLSTRGYMNMMRDVLRHSRDANEIGVFTDWRMWVNTTDALEYAGYTMRAMVVWAKRRGGMGRPWRNQHELLAFGMRGPATKDRIAKHGTVIECGLSGNANHPAEKPIELITKIVDNMAPGRVIDPFCGSGTTLRAAKTLGRSAIGIEIEERYCEIAASRCAQDVLALDGTA